VFKNDKQCGVDEMFEKHYESGDSYVAENDKLIPPAVKAPVDSLRSVKYIVNKRINENMPN